jgi:Ca-activated chloride channel homolog
MYRAWTERVWTTIPRGLLGIVLVAGLSGACAKSAPDDAAPPMSSPATAGESRVDGKFGPSEKGRAGAADQPGAAGMPAPTLAPPPSPSSAGPADAEESQVAIDPNGRFATTYRPGGGHLAAFESAVARGVVPAAEREVVSEIGARYAPAIDAPKDKAIIVKTDLERGKLGPTGGPTHARITLRSTAATTAARPHLSVHLVLDVSGSMAGEPIRRAREAAHALVDKLAAGDDFSLVTFSSDAQVRVPDGPVGARRASIKKTIDEIVEGGGTNISRGLELGYQEAAKPGIPADAVKVVMLMSDGRANAGIIKTDRISKLALDAFQSGIQTSSFGVGTDYDGELMSAIAGDGAGGYYYLRDADQLGPALGTELDKRVDPVATAVELRIRLKKGVTLKRVYGSRRLTEEETARVRAVEVASDKQAEKKDGIKRDREDDAKGGMRFFIPAFARDDSHAILLQVELPEGVGVRELADVELKYKDRIAKKNVVEEVPVKVTYGNSDAESAASADASVARTVQGFAAGETLTRAARHISRGQRDVAVALLVEREGILRKAAETLAEPLFLKDAERLARLRGHAGTTTGMGDPLVLAMLMETAGHVHLH